MILTLPKFKIGQEVYCHLKDCDFLTKIEDFYKINGIWNYEISAENYNGKGIMVCPECYLSTKVYDKKITPGTYIEEND